MEAIQKSDITMPWQLPGMSLWPDLAWNSWHSVRNVHWCYVQSNFTCLLSAVW